MRFLDGARVDTSDPRHLSLIGQILGKIHTVLQHEEPPPNMFRWDQIGGAFGGAASALPTDLTMGFIHCDPHADSFRIGETAVGIID